LIQNFEKTPRLPILKMGVNLEKELLDELLDQKKKSNIFPHQLMK
jgi:hypothetical protein